MNKWFDVLDTFDDEERYYNGRYMIQDKVYGQDLESSELEMSIFEPVDEEAEGLYEIYFSLRNAIPTFYGVSYAKKDEVMARQEAMKKELEEVVDTMVLDENGKFELKDGFINDFCDRYDVDIPILGGFDVVKMAEALSEIFKKLP